MTVLQRENQKILSNENWVQGNQIDDLKERVAVLEQEEVKQPVEQTNVFSYLGKRREVESYGAFEIEERHPEKRKSNTDQLAKRITALTKKFLSK